MSVRVCVPDSGCVAGGVMNVTISECVCECARVCVPDSGCVAGCMMDVTMGECVCV